MLNENTNFYWRTNDELNSRLDFVYYHPDFDFIKEFRNSNKTFKCGNIISEPEYGNSLSGRTEGAIGFLNGQHISEEGEIMFSENPLFVNAALTNNDLLDIDDILISRSGTVGKTAVITEEYQRFAFGSFCIRFKIIDKKKNDPAFVSKFINSNLGIQQVDLLKTGSVQSNINSDQIKDINIPDLELTQQMLILNKIKPFEEAAKSLKAEAIKLQNEALNHLLEELDINVPVNPNYFFKSGAEKQTLTFHVYPHEANERINYLFFHPKYKALEELQEKFITVPLESICEKVITPGVQPEFIEGGERIALKTVDIKNRFIDYKNALRVSELFYKSNLFAEVQKNDIIIAATGYVSMGKVDVFENDEPALISGELLKFKVCEDYDPYFVTYFLRSHLGQIQIEKYWTGSSGQIHLYDKDVKKFIFPSSKSIPKKRQEEIAKAIRIKIEQAIKLEIQATAKLSEARNLFESLVLGIMYDDKLKKPNILV